LAENPNAPTRDTATLAFDPSLYWAKPDDKRRRTIENSAKAFLAPQQIYDLMTAPGRGWGYKQDEEVLRRRDRALISLIYLVACRTSEAGRLTKGQFVLQVPKARWLIMGMELSKVRSKTNPKWRERHSRYREGWLPLRAKDPARRKMVELVLDHVKLLEPNERIFPHSTRRTLQIVNSYLGTWTHYLRMAGLEYLYDAWGHDVVAVSNYVKIDIRTLQHYLHGLERPPV
jgi:integrase